MNRVRYNTDLVFSISQKTGMPFNEVVHHIYDKGIGKKFDNAYSKRKDISFDHMVNEISKDIN